MKNSNKYNYDDDSDSSYDDFAEQLGGQVYTEVAENKTIEIPQFDSEEYSSDQPPGLISQKKTKSIFSSDSSNSSNDLITQPNQIHAENRQNYSKLNKNNSNNRNSPKNQQNQTDSSDSHHSSDYQNDDFENFSTSKIQPDLKQLDQKTSKLSSSDDDDEIILIKNSRQTTTQRPQAKSVAALLHTSSSDDDQFNPTPKSKPKANSNKQADSFKNSHRKTAESVSPKDRKNLLNDRYSYVSNDFNNDDNISQRSSTRSPARSIAPSSASRRWTPEVAKESQLDITLKRLQDRNAKLAETDERSVAASSRRSKNNGNEKLNEEEFELPLQIVAEKQYAKMLRKKCPKLVSIKEEIYADHNKQFNVDFNQDIVHWSRDMIAEENSRIQDRLERLRIKIDDVREDNVRMRKEIDRIRKHGLMNSNRNNRNNRSTNDNEDNNEGYEYNYSDYYD
ncbi:hypothetical protein TRFO_21923 [Tritrichomonas foetus]|uniref:Uncharacterized protein n=1 Tax=Tritrichomonas foetus TaxID=1144522 RepID=A0A1J4KCW5_9EUKA|nr:hypothetical protein TRFO_21923 [Tritrichomonas foetus]|eukprot:OHT09265.1 hypothetical protein TRFO_21923 [Tritrichomonas foetus]